MSYNPRQHLPWYKGLDGKGLIIYTNATIVLKRNLQRSWLGFMHKHFPSCLCIEAPLLISTKTLELRGHLRRFAHEDQGEVFACGQLSLRPEICQSVYDFYAARHRKGVFTPIVQIGRCARKERTTEGGLNRLAQFTQADLQLINPVDSLESVRDLAIQWVRSVVDGSVRAIVKQDRAHYASMTYDIEVLSEGNWRQVCSVNDRGTHDLGTSPIYEASFGLDRIIGAILKTGGLALKIVAQGDPYLQLVTPDPTTARKLLQAQGFSLQ